MGRWKRPRDRQRRAGLAFQAGRRERVVDWLGLDSKIDSTLAETWARFRDVWNAGTSFFARFKLTGWRRLAQRGGLRRA